MKIAISSGKGGTGKTTISTNLAAYIAEKKEIIFCDLDVEEPNSALIFKPENPIIKDDFKMVPKWNSENCTLCGQCQSNCNFNAVLQISNEILIFDELCHSCYACTELCPSNSLPMSKIKIGEMRISKIGNLNLIESRLNIGEERAVPLIADTKSYANNNFNTKSISIYDSPPGTSCPVIETVKGSDLVILVTEPTPFGFHDLKLAIETLELLKQKFVVVINKDGIGNDNVENYCKKNNIPIIAKIKADKEIAKLYSKGEFIYKTNKEFKTEIIKIAKYIDSLYNNINNFN